jgi:hypothetical protein
MATQLTLRGFVFADNASVSVFGSKLVFEMVQRTRDTQPLNLE